MSLFRGSLSPASHGASALTAVAHRWPCRRLRPIRPFGDIYARADAETRAGQAKDRRRGPMKRGHGGGRYRGRAVEGYLPGLGGEALTAPRPGVLTERGGVHAHHRRVGDRGVRRLDGVPAGFARGCGHGGRDRHGPARSGAGVVPPGPGGDRGLASRGGSGGRGGGPEAVPGGTGRNPARAGPRRLRRNGGKERTFVTRVGPVTLKRRHRRRRGCGKGRFPLDHALEPRGGSITPGAERTLAGGR